MPSLILNKEKFLAVLNEKKLNMTEAAQVMGIDRSHLFRVLNETQFPGRKFIEGAMKICEGYSLDELFSSTTAVTKSPITDDHATLDKTGTEEG